MRGRALHDVLRIEGADGFESFMAAAQRVGHGIAKVLAGLNPNAYFAVIVLLGFSAAIPLVAEVANLDHHVPLGAGVLLGALAALLGILLRLRGRLTRALALGLIGAAVALLFRMLSAPDLMLTQLLVEVLLTVFLALSLRLLMRHPTAPPKKVGPRLGQIAIALVAGLGAAGLAAALLVTPRDTRLLSFYLQAAPEIAQGRNLVNVILVDFRSLDTLVETIVVVLAALGVAGLALRREVPFRARSEATADSKEGGQR